MEEALGTARAYAAAANATGSSLDNTFGAMAISVDESKPTYEVSNDQGRSSDCVYCQRFGSAAQRCGHNPPLRFPRSRGYWPPFRQTSRGSIAPRVPPPDTLAKLHKEGVGPYIVRKIYNETTCRISRADLLESQSYTVHFNRLKPATQCRTDMGENPNTSGVTPPDAAVFVEVATEGGLSIVQGSGEDTANQSGEQCNGTSQ
ncbi:hypothetical protein AHF37_03633 [Paragonimus kellicotti]|nr:hypothetical protein AHF37_03633 [Paragonimus kellicotti]